MARPKYMYALARSPDSSSGIAPFVSSRAALTMSPDPATPAFSAALYRNGRFPASPKMLPWPTPLKAPHARTARSVRAYGNPGRGTAPCGSVCSVASSSGTATRHATYPQNPNSARRLASMRWPWRMRSRMHARLVKK